MASFHPHLGTIVETAQQLERVLDHTSIGLCPDTGHALLAGDDPAALIRRHAERLVYVHLKDADLDTGAFVPLGTGSLRLSDTLAAVGETGYDGWLTVELDAWPDPLQGAQISRRALTRLMAAERPD